MLITLSWWDAALLVAISLHATAIAYTHDPRRKAVLMTLPIPFTMASLALGLMVDVTHVLGLANLLLFNHAVRVMHYRIKLPIVMSIALGILLYIGVGALGAQVVPRTMTMFWIACVVNLTLGSWLHFRRKHADEPGHRSPLPLHVKLPAVMGVVSGLILIKRLLGGFATTFPMVGTIAAYEMRGCLATNCQGLALTLLITTPMQITCLLTQDHLGLGGALACGWLAAGTMMALLLPSYLKKREIVQALTERPGERDGVL